MLTPTATGAMPRRAATTAVWHAQGMPTVPTGSASLGGAACPSMGLEKGVLPISGANLAPAMLISVIELHFLNLSIYCKIAFDLKFLRETNLQQQQYKYIITAKYPVS